MDRLKRERPGKHVEIYTDGACSGNPGPGGWGAILIYGEHKRELSDHVAGTTNNRMELFAAISALGALKEACDVTLYTDSSYLANAFNEHWVESWVRNGWVKPDKKAVLNRDLWLILLAQTKKHNVRFVHVKGHADNPYNNRCDELARKAIAEYTRINGQSGQEGSAADNNGKVTNVPDETNKINGNSETDRPAALPDNREADR